MHPIQQVRLSFLEYVGGFGLEGTWYKSFREEREE